MPTVPEQPSWSTAPLAVTLVCDDRQDPDCLERVTVHVSSDDANQIDRRRPLGAGRAFLKALPVRAPGWEFSFPFAPRPETRRVVCPNCLEDIADAYYRPRPPAPEVGPGHVAWWQGCRTFRCGEGLPKGGVALERGRWEVVTEFEAQRRREEIERGKERLAGLLVKMATERYRKLFGVTRLPSIDAFEGWMNRVGMSWGEFTVADLPRETVLRMIELGPVDGWWVRDEATGKARRATPDEIARIVDAARSSFPPEPDPNTRRRTARKRAGD